MTTGSPGLTAVTYLRAFFAARLQRLAEARASKDRGASAIELAIITAVLVLAAAGVLTIIFNVIQTKGNQIQSNSNTIP